MYVTFTSMNREQEEILEKIEFFRKKFNFSQEQMAEKMNITQSSYARFESGRSKTDLKVLILFCEKLKLTLKEFFIFPSTLNSNNEDVKAIIQIELKKEKKEQILKLIFGENNLEILNK